MIANVAWLGLGAMLLGLIVAAPVMRCSPALEREIVISGETGKAEIRLVEVCK